MIGELVERWHRGWIAADGLTSEHRDGYLVVRVDRPHRRFEWIATDDAETTAMARVVAATSEPNWLSVPTHAPEKVCAELEAAGMVVARPDETFTMVGRADLLSRGSRAWVSRKGPKKLVS